MLKMKITVLKKKAVIKINISLDQDLAEIPVTGRYYTILKITT